MLLSAGFGLKRDRKIALGNTVKLAPVPHAGAWHGKISVVLYCSCSMHRSGRQIFQFADADI